MDIAGSVRRHVERPGVLRREWRTDLPRRTVGLCILQPVGFILPGKMHAIGTVERRGETRIAKAKLCATGYGSRRPRRACPKTVFQLLSRRIHPANLGPVLTVKVQKNNFAESGCCQLLTQQQTIVEQHLKIGVKVGRRRGDKKTIAVLVQGKRIGVINYRVSLPASFASARIVEVAIRVGCEIRGVRCAHRIDTKIERPSRLRRTGPRAQSSNLPNRRGEQCR